MASINRRSAYGVTVATLIAAFTAGEVRAAPEPVRSFGAIQQVFSGSCALISCHSAVARQGNLILEHEDLSYTSLVDHDSFHPDADAMPPAKRSY